MDIGHPKYDPSLKNQPPLEPPSWFSGPKNNDTSKKPEKSVVDVTPKPTLADPAAPTPIASPDKKEYFWPAYLGGIIVIGIIVFFGVRAASSLFDIWTNLEPDQKPAETATVPESTSTPAATEAAATPTPEPQTTPAPTPEPTPAPAAVAIDPATLKVRVLNGSGVPGAASTAADVLIAAKIPVASTGNARKFSYRATMVYYPAGKKDAATLVADALTTYTPQLEENAVADGYDALVVVGAK